MSGFWAALGRNLADLPGNLVRGLRPGTGGEADRPARRMRRAFVYHLHPLQVSARSLRPLTTLGLGLTALTLFLALCLTGVLLMIYYVPTTRDALASTQDIQHAVAFGAFVRALHRWAGHGMVAVVVLHLVRVWATGAYVRRELNWLLGLALLVMTLALAFTGYLLPWDQLSFWAVSVSANLMDHVPWFGDGLKRLLLGGDSVGQAALSRFYMLHVAGLPALMIAVLVYHLWRVRKDGGLAVPAGAPVERRPAWPHLVLREAILILLVLAAFSLLSLYLDAPLGGVADPHNPSNPEKTPWYFLWLQEMVSYSAVVGGFVFPGVLLLGLLALPWLEREELDVGRWFGPRAGRIAVIVSAVLSVAALAVFVTLYLSGGANAKVSNWLNPATGMIVLSALVFLAAGTLSRSTRVAFLAGLAVLAVAVLGFTLLGVCRGPNWILYWPWEEWPLVW